MTEIYEIEKQIKVMIDELKGVCSTKGLSNSADEERIITTIFLYKFLNDKFTYEMKKFADETDYTLEELYENVDDSMDAFYDNNSRNVAFGLEDTITALIKDVNSDEFYKLFDNALLRISNSVKNEAFVIETAEGTKVGLFEPISTNIESQNKNSFAQAIFSIISQEKIDFSNAFSKKFDFFASIFEYLIKDYNSNSGVYAEYFTPQFCSKIIGKILVGSTEKIKASEIYDPSAGSGSLVLHLAHELGEDAGFNRAVVYTQDISQKSSRLLRINLLLNGLADSLHNVRRGDTLLSPAHYEVENNPLSGMKKFDYIVSNPPFKMDFSSTRDQIENKWNSTDRFFAGIPNVPKSKKEAMAIYQLFLQHIIYSLKENGKAAIVVPTGFCTEQAKIGSAIRKKLVDEKMLKGVIQMPSNIFATTGTNVSILFIDKENKDGKVLLMDASKLGTKVKDGKTQKTVLNTNEENYIIDTFVRQEVIENFSVLVDYQEIIEKSYSFNAGQYFTTKIQYLELSHAEFEHKINTFSKNLTKYFKESSALDKSIFEQLEVLKYE